MQREINLLSKESEKKVIEFLALEKADEFTIDAFYFLYLVGITFDDIKNGEELYDYFQKKSTEFAFGRDKIVIEYMKKVDENSFLFRLGKKLLVNFREGEISKIFYNNHHRNELVEIFNSELFLKS